MKYPAWSIWLIWGAFVLAMFSAFLGDVTFAVIAIILGVGSFIFLGYYWLFHRPKLIALGFGPIESLEGGFTFTPPSGWTVEQNAQSPFPACFGPATGQLSIRGGFRPNVTFEIDTISATMEDALDRVVGGSSGSISEWTELSSTKVVIKEKNRGIRLLAEGILSPHRLRWLIYAFERTDGVKLLIYCVSPKSLGATLDPHFDQCISSMVIR